MGKNFIKIVIGCAIVACAFIAQQGMCSDSIIRGGYWENWQGALNPEGSDPNVSSYYANDLENFDLVYYSFLTLAKVPDPYSPPKSQWDGQAIYESMTQADVLTVMTTTSPEWANPYDWQRKKFKRS